LLLLLFLFLTGSELEASAWKPNQMQAGFYVGQRFRHEQNLAAGFAPQWEQSSRFLYQANVVLALDLDWYSFGTVSCVLDSGEISEDTIQDGTLDNDRTDDAFFQQGYFESYFLDDQGVAFKVGQQHIVSGDSYILDDFLLAGQMGLDLHAMLDLPWELYGSVTRIQGSSLYFQLKAVHPFTAYERLALSIGWLHDTEGLLAQLLEETVSQIPGSPAAGLSFESQSDIVWLALSAKKVVSGFRFSLVGILNTGSSTLSGIDNGGRAFRSDFSSLGYLIDFLVGRSLTDRLVLDLFYLMASGEDDPAGAIQGGEILHAYLSIVPFITRTNLFFNGGINENFSTRSFGTAGHSARGFGAPGIRMTYSFLDNLWMIFKAAYLFSAASPPERAAGRTYGWETDLMGYWDIGDHVRLSMEADLFLPGGFFERPELTDPDPAYRLMGGVDFFF